MTLRTVLIIDPPSGWKYGFPKPFINPNNYSVEKWLRRNKYPRSEINKLRGRFPCRYWNTEILELEYQIEVAIQRSL